jgi:hypothetical protein
MNAEPVDKRRDRVIATTDRARPEYDGQTVDAPELLSRGNWPTGAGYCSRPTRSSRLALEEEK